MGRVSSSMARLASLRTLRSCTDCMLVARSELRVTRCALGSADRCCRAAGPVRRACDISSGFGRVSTSAMQSVRSRACSAASLSRVQAAVTAPDWISCWCAAICSGSQTVFQVFSVTAVSAVYLVGCLSMYRGVGCVMRIRYHIMVSRTCMHLFVRGADPS